MISDIIYVYCNILRISNKNGKNTFVLLEFKNCINNKLTLSTTSSIYKQTIHHYLHSKQYILLVVLILFVELDILLVCSQWSGLLLLHTSDFSVNFSGSKARCRAKVLLRGRKNMWLGHHQRYVVPDRVPIHRRTRCHRAKPASTTSHSATTTIPYTHSVDLKPKKGAVQESRSTIFLNSLQKSMFFGKIFKE